MADGFQKLDQVEKSIAQGDVKGADAVLKTITDPADQQIFSSIMKSQCQSNDGALPPCTVDGDSIHFGGDHKMTMSAKDGKLGMTDDQPSSLDALKEKAKDVWNGFTHLPETIGNGIRDTVQQNTDVGDALKRAGTADSETNRRVDRQVNQAIRVGDSDK